MATKKSSSAVQQRQVTGGNGRSGPPSGGKRGGRGGQREIVVVQQGPSTAMWGIVIAVVVVGIFLGTLLILDITSRNKGANPTAANQAQQGQQQPQLTVAQLEQLVQQQPANTQARLELAWAYYNQRELDKAELQVAAVLRSDPNNYQALDYMGLVQAGRSKFSEALTYLDKGLAANPPDKVDLLWDKGRILIEMKRYKEAIATFEEFAALPRIKGSGDEKVARDIIEKAKADLAKTKK